VRALLVDDVKLDLVSRHKWIGRERVERYFTNYARLSDWFLVPAHLDGRLVLARLSVGACGATGLLHPSCLRGQRVIAIRDFRHVPYIARDARVRR